MAKKKTPLSLTTDYEKQLYARQKYVQKQIDALYNKLINEIAPLASIYKLPGGVFSLSKLPALNALIDKKIKALNDNILSSIRSGVGDAWQLSNNKNDLIADIRIDRSLIPGNAVATFYDTNKDALSQFLERKQNGLNLSERIYKQGQQFKAELELGIGEGIATGSSAASLSRDLKIYLNNPDTLFRRVRDAKGILRISRNAKAYHPGQGVYRSASKNAKRLAITEINMAYRSADMLRYQQSPFILGFEVKTSAQHPKLDICDYMAGEYPVTFQFSGWHPHCLCFEVPILMNPDQFREYRKLLLAGTDTPANVGKVAKRINDIPESAKGFIEKNAERFSGWKQPPLWWQQNDKFVPKI